MPPDNETLQALRNSAISACRKRGVANVDDIFQDAVLKILEEEKIFDASRCTEGAAGLQKFLRTRGSYACIKAADKEAKWKQKHRSLPDE